MCRLASAEHDASGAVVGPGRQPPPVDLPHDLRQSGDCCISRQGVRHRPETEKHLRKVAVAMLPGRKLDMAVSALGAGIELRRLCKLIACLIIREAVNGVTSLIHILVLVFVAASFSKELVELGHQLVNRSLFLVERCFDAVKKILIGLKKATARRG